VVCEQAAHALSGARRSGQGQEAIMGKYFLAWILGVPAVVLVVIYLLLN
jgi:hypothetical protein